MCALSSLTDLCMEMGFWFLQWGRPCSWGTSCAYFSHPSPATSWRPAWVPLPPVLPSFRTTWSWPLMSICLFLESTIFKTTLWSFWCLDMKFCQKIWFLSEIRLLEYCGCAMRGGAGEELSYCKVKLSHSVGAAKLHKCFCYNSLFHSTHTHTEIRLEKWFTFSVLDREKLPFEVVFPEEEIATVKRS